MTNSIGDLTLGEINICKQETWYPGILIINKSISQSKLLVKKVNYQAEIYITNSNQLTKIVNLDFLILKILINDLSYYYYNQLLFTFRIVNQCADLFTVVVVFCFI